LNTVEPPDISIAVRLQRGLANVLTSTLRELLGLLGFADFLAVYTVLCHHRAAGRIVVPGPAADQVQSLILKSGVACRRAPYRLRKIPSRVRGTDHLARAVMDDPDADILLHFGVSDVVAEAAELASLTQNHELMGQLFAYPECCVAAYKSSRFPQADRTTLSIPSIGPFPAEMNPVTGHLFRPLAFLFHFPCSVGCETSLFLRRSRQSCIQTLFPEISRVDQLGRGIALYGERIGIGLITSWSEAGGGYYRIHRVVTKDRRLRRLLAQGSTAALRLTDPHDFQIGETAFAGLGDAAAIFQ
jgi:hypothetical protein